MCCYKCLYFFAFLGSVNKVFYKCFFGCVCDYVRILRFSSVYLFFWVRDSWFVCSGFWREVFWCFCACFCISRVFLCFFGVCGLVCVCFM